MLVLSEISTKGKSERKIVINKPRKDLRKEEIRCSGFEIFRFREEQSKRFDYNISQSRITTRYLLLLGYCSLHVTLPAYHPRWASSTLITCKNKIGYSYIVGK